MKLTSTAFENEGDIPNKYTCQGEDISPELMISDVPSNVKSFVLIMDDPDAIKPVGRVWDHWVVFNIPADVKEIKEGKEPNGIKGMTSFGKLGYGGPCPPDTKHRYYFRVYALDVMLELNEGATKDKVLDAIEGHVLAQAELMGRYEKI